MTPSKPLQALLALLPADTAGLEFGQLLLAIDEVRFTGTVTLDFMNGRPRQISLGPPIRLGIYQGERPSTRRLDTDVRAGGG